MLPSNQEEENMAGTEASKQEKEAIRQLCRDGYSIDEIKSRYPHIDGRVISGVAAKLRQEQGSVEAPNPSALPPSPASPTPPPPQRPASQPPPPGGGVKAPEVLEAERTGFTPASHSSRLPEGFQPAYREYYIVKKLDGENPGIKGQEYPPFSIAEFMHRYREPGEYEVTRYLDGRLAGTFRERVASAGKHSVTADAPRQDTPVDSFFRTLEAVRNFQHDGKSEAAHARATEATASAEKERAKAQVETAATVGLIDLVKNATAPRPDTMGPALQQILALSQEQSRASEDRHKRDMEELRTRQQHEANLDRERIKADRETERERIRADQEKFKEDMRQRQTDRDGFLAKMAEIEQKRDEFHRESYERMITEIGSTREAAEREIEERKASAKELIDAQKKFNDEMIALKKTMGGAASDIEVAKIVKDGIVGGLDRIGHRVDMMIEHRGQEQVQPRGGQAAPRREAEPRAEAAPKKKEGAGVLTDDEATLEARKPWFTQLKTEVLATLAARAKGRKLHGGVLGQVFLENLNERKGVSVAHLHWLCSRTWAQVIEKAGDVVTEEEKKLMLSEDGEKWYEEFVWFLSESYNRSLTGS
jgi:hypothetical protein